MTKQIVIDNTTHTTTLVEGNIYISLPNLMIEVGEGLDHDLVDGVVVSTPVERVLYAVPLPEWETWAIGKWGYETVQEAKRLLWMHT